MKGIRGSTEFEKQFIDVFEQLCRRHHSWKVWQDFVNMSACAIANAVDKRPAVWKLREDSYMETIKSYSKDELNLISELLSITTLALDENPAQDFLGKFYMQLDFGSGWHGQFFTPWHVAELMAKLQLGDEAKDQIASEDYISVCDSCCGAGCMLMAFAKVCKDDMDSRIKSWNAEVRKLEETVKEERESPKSEEPSKSITPEIVRSVPTVHKPPQMPIMKKSEGKKKPFSWKEFFTVKGKGKK